MTYDYPDPENESHTCQPGCIALRAAILRLDPTFYDLGCYVDRNIRNGDEISLHAVGRAIDIGIDATSPQSAYEMTSVTHSLAKYGEHWGVQCIIWQRFIWTQAKGWHDYTGPAGPHTTHTHIEMTIAGAGYENALEIAAHFSLDVEELEIMQPEDYIGIANAILDSKIPTTYDEGTPEQRDVEVPLRNLLGNLAINADRIVHALGRQG